MATSNTYNFSLTNADVVASAYALLQIRRPALLAEHMIDARTQLNLLFSSWSNLQVNLFCVDLVSVTLTQGTATYAVDPSTIMILDAYISYTEGVNQDRLIFPISRTEFASYPDKTLQQTPSVFWFDRLLAPTITLWGVPDTSTAYILKYYRCYQNQDANIPSGETPAIPYRWLDACVTGLAARLAKIYKPELEDKREADATKAWNIAATQDTENVNLYIVPGLETYTRT